MSQRHPAEGNREQVTITDKRKIDPETGEARVTASATAEAKSESGSSTRSVEESEGPLPEDQITELTADLQRLQADFANYRKRALRDLEAAVERGKAAVVSELLAILDDLDRARDHGDLESGPLKVMADKLNAVLNSFGLAAYGAEGDEFDPALHEAVHHEGDGNHSVIGNVLRLGYRLGEHVLRHAMVGVIDGDREPEAPPEQAEVEKEKPADGTDE